MKVRYAGDVPVLLMHEGRVWEVHPGDEMDLPTVPNSGGRPLPGWVRAAAAVKEQQKEETE